MIKNAFAITTAAVEACPEFYKNFRIDGRARRAVLAVTAAGVYDVTVNGKRAGDNVLAPGCTSYSSRLQYQEYDISELLKEENEICICAAPGWYRGRISGACENLHSEPCSVIAALDIQLESGERKRIITDGSWMVRSSGVVFSDIYDGECQDASAEVRELGSAEIYEGFDYGALIPQEGEDVRETVRIYPRRVFVTPVGERIIDFGQNISGYVCIDADIPRGERIRLSHAEVLYSDGNFYNENYRDAKAQLIFTGAGGKRSYKPRFTFFGFRYVRLDECPDSIDPMSFTACAVHSDMKRTGRIITGSDGINRLYSNALWSQRDNFVDIPTDCPQRNERMGWLGDAQVFAAAAAYNYDVRRFFNKWLKDVCAEQRENGSVPDTVPNFWKLKGSSTAWGDAITIIPWRLYTVYGDTKALENCFDSMRRWVDYISADTLEKDLWICSDEDKKLWGKHYGDWLGLDSPQGSYKGASDDDFIASAFYAYSTSLLIKTGEALGRDMSEYRELYNRIVSAFRARFRARTQTEHVLLIYFGLAEDIKSVGNALNSMVIDNGCAMTTGFVGAPYLLHALSMTGHTDTAYELLMRREYPSWLYCVDKGATTIWEHWDGIKEDGSFWSSDMNSFNHYAYGSVVDWLYSVSAGIVPIEEYPGFERVMIAPVPDRRLGFINASLDTVCGRIESSWRYDGDCVRYEITVAMPADIVIDGVSRSVEPGSYIFYGRA